MSDQTDPKPRADVEDRRRIRDAARKGDRLDAGTYRLAIIGFHDAVLRLRCWPMPRTSPGEIVFVDDTRRKSIIRQPTHAGQMR